MRDRLNELGDDTVVVLVTFTTEALLSGYLERNKLSFEVLIDADRHTYQAYGLGRGSWRRVWGARAARRYVEIVRRDGLTGVAKPTEDTLQLGGDFVISPNGTLGWGFWGEGPDDRPTVDDLIAALDACRSSGGTSDHGPD